MIKLFLVGGAVRDELLGVPSHDWDFTVEAESFDAMKSHLQSAGFTIFVDNPEFLTIRARFPKSDWNFGGKQMAVTTADFVLARKEGAYTDGRHPVSVEPGTILDDLRRRDFTINAIAQDVRGNLIDPHGGQRDIDRKLIRAVGSAHVRIGEDALRGLRAIRFSITKGFTISPDILDVLDSNWFLDSLSTVSRERIREEMFKTFSHSTRDAMAFFRNRPVLFDFVFDGALWLKPTMEK